MNEALDRIEQTARRHPHLAIKLFRQLEQCANQEQRVSLALNALTRRAFICERLSHAGTLADELFAGLQRAETNNLPYQACRIMLCLGRLHFTQGIYNEAIRFWIECLDLCKVTHDTEIQIEAKIGLGQIYDALSDWKTGARFYHDAGHLLEKFDRPYLKCKHAINLAVNSMQMGQYELAHELFAVAQTQATAGKIREYVAEIHWHLASLAKLESDLETAIVQVQLAMQLASQCEYTWLLASAANTLGEILAAKQDNEAALVAHVEALAYADSCASRQQKVRACDALSRLYEATQSPLQALNFARTHHQLSAEIAELATISQVRELRKYDLSSKPPVELLLELSSDSQLEEKSLEDALEHIATAALNVLQIESFCLWIKNPATGLLTCQVVAGILAFPFGPGKVLEHQHYLKYYQVIHNLHTPVSTYDVRLHPAAEELAVLYEGCTMHSLLEISVRMHGHQIGVLSFGKTELRRNWTREDVLFGSHIANLIEQVMAHEEYRQAQNILENRVNERTKELRQQTDALRTVHNNISMLSEIGREITSQLSREGIMSTLYEHVKKLMDAEAFSIGIYKPEQGIIAFPCNILRDQHLLPYDRDMNDPDLLSVWCIQHRKEIFINDIQEDYVHFIGRDGLDKLTADSSFPCPDQKIYPRSFIYAPLIIKDRILGLISVQSTAANSFERMHADMLTTLAAYTAVAFDNADTYQQLSSAQQLLMSKEKLAALGALVAGIAHEINTPLGNCLLTATTLKEQTAKFIKLMEEGGLKRSNLNQFTEVLGEANDMLTRNLHNASELVSSFKQVSVDQTSQQKRAFNLLKTSQEIVRTMQVRINKDGHQLHLDIPEDIEIDSFPGPYGQVITNFINNALVHGFDGREQGKMHLTATRLDKDNIKICFSDNGKGIKAEHLRRIFDPFFTTKLGQGGSGLGMNIVHNIIHDLLGGSIQVDSTEGVGTTITVVLSISR